MEALLRWNSPQLGAVAPGEFIPLAEDTGLILPIGTWVIRQACLQNKAWQDAGLKPRRVAVNVSACQFTDGSVPRRGARGAGRKRPRSALPGSRTDRKRDDARSATRLPRNWPN